jgi:hypothetical protein
MSADDIREQIEASIVDLIKTKVENEEMSDERAQQIAARVLELLKPGMSLEELYRALPHLDDDFSEVGHIIVPYMKDYEMGVTKHAIGQVQDLIKTGRYKEAQDLADRVIKQNVKLVWTGSAKPEPSQTH